MQEPSVNLLTYWQFFFARRKFIGAIVTLAVMGAAIVTMFLSPVYRSETVILPISGGGRDNAVAMALGGLGSLSGFLDSGGGSSSQLLALLRSRTLAERVIHRANLLPILFPKDPPTMDQAALSVRAAMVFQEEKKMQTITVAGHAPTPELAALLARNYVEALQEFINANAFTLAKRYRLYIEAQLAKNKRELLEAGKELNSFYREGRISSIESKVDVPIPAVPLAGDMLTEMTNFHSAIAAVEAEKAGVEAKLSTAENVVRGVPQQVYLQYLTLRRELLGKISALLTQQYETAKMEESKDELSFQVIDQALPPRNRFKPRRKRILLTAAIVAFFGSCGAIVAVEWLRQLRRMQQ